MARARWSPRMASSTSSCAARTAPSTTPRAGGRRGRAGRAWAARSTEPRRWRCDPVAGSRSSPGPRTTGSTQSTATPGAGRAGPACPGRPCRARRWPGATRPVVWTSSCPALSAGCTRRRSSTARGLAGSGWTPPCRHRRASRLPPAAGGSSSTGRPEAPPATSSMWGGGSATSLRRTRARAAFPGRARQAPKDDRGRTASNMSPRMREELKPSGSSGDPDAVRPSAATSRPAVSSTFDHGAATLVPRAPRRRVGAWDILGMLSLASVMIAVESSVVEVLGTEVGRPREFRVAGSALASATVIMLAFLTLGAPPPLAAVPRLLTRVWRDPPGAWVSFVLGVVVSVPVLALFSPLLGGDSDSARLLASVRYVQREGLGYLVDTQEPYLPPLLLTPVLAVGGLAGAKLVAILLVQVLAGTNSFVVHVLSRSMWGAAAAAVSL